MTMHAPLLQVNNVIKNFGAVRALRGVSLSLCAGEVHALLGENGAGKSTLIKLITGAHQPDGGDIAIGGHVEHRLTPASAHALGVAAIYQQPALFPDLSVAENIALGLERPRPARRVRWGERRSRARDLLQRIGAHIDPDAEVRRLSMPEQQLVEIARALGAGARIMIMDEPTASLTQQEVQLLFGVIRELRSHAVGVIYISHRLDEIFAIADRVTVLRDGESVGSHPVSAVGETDLIKLMVGREISTIFRPSERPPGAAVLSLSGVGCRASGVHDVTLHVRSGEVLGVAGLVGAGRTELARILFGITPADAGEIVLDGVPLVIRSPRDALAAGIGYLPEDRRRHGVILELPVAANITLAILPRLFPRSWLRFSTERQVASEYCRDLAVKTTTVDAPTHSLSGGNQQKVALARWLATKPRVLILDEPTQGVDIGAKAEIHRIIRHLAASGLAVLMISSDLPEVLGMSDRIAVMRGGTVVAMSDAADATAHLVMAAALGQATTQGAA